MLKTSLKILSELHNILCNYRYSGPGSQLILDKWKVDFNTYMSSGLSYIVMEVDGYVNHIYPKKSGKKNCYFESLIFLF